MPYSKRKHGDIIYISFVTLDIPVSGYPKGEKLQVLLGTFDKKTKSILCFHHKSSSKTRIALSNITPVLKF